VTYPQPPHAALYGGQEEVEASQNQHLVECRPQSWPAKGDNIAIDTGLSLNASVLYLTNPMV